MAASQDTINEATCKAKHDALDRTLERIETKLDEVLGSHEGRLTVLETTVRLKNGFRREVREAETMVIKRKEFRLQTWHLIVGIILLLSPWLMLLFKK